MKVFQVCAKFLNSTAITRSYASNAAAVAAVKSGNPDITFNKLFINNEWVDAESGKTFGTFNPANGQKICDVAEAGAADVDRAIRAAQAAFEPGSEWRRTDPSYRGRLLFRLAELIERDHEYLAALESLDNGKAFSEANNIDVVMTRKCYEYYAGWSNKFHGKQLPIDGPFFAYTTHEPIGVVGAILPWNFPLVLQSWKLAPALAMGNTVVLKTAEQTPLSSNAMANLIKEAGFPPGVVNIVPGFGAGGAGEALSRDGRVDKLAFTGSTQVGRLIAQQCHATNLKRLTLELGGKSALIVFPDADLDQAVSVCQLGLYLNAGQCCCASSRIFVHAQVYDAFVERMAARVSHMKMGGQFEEGVVQGPQIDATQQQQILAYIDSGKQEGATLVAGGGCGAAGQDGFFVEPTLFAGVRDDMRIAREEIFGPVMQVMRWDDEADMIRRANSSEYGLAAGLITTRIDKALSVAPLLRVGSVWVNCYDNFDATLPFGGYKESGIGRDRGEYALQHFTEVKAVCVQLPEKLV